MYGNSELRLQTTYGAAAAAAAALSASFKPSDTSGLGLCRDFIWVI